MSGHLFRRATVASAAAVVAALAVAGTASAHIDPDPTTVAGGTTVTVAFTVEHGCDGSPTTKLEIKAPDGATDPKGIDVAGFTASTSEQVVSFTGGSLGADTEQAFQVSFGAPAAGGDLAFPIIQTCQEGEIDWIQVEQPGQPEPDHPAPVVTVTPAAGDATTTTAATATTAAGKDEATTTAASGEGKGDGAVSSSVVSQAEEDEEGSSSSSAPTVIGVVIFVLLMIGGGVWGYRYARTHNAGGFDDPEPSAATDAPGPDAPADAAADAAEAPAPEDPPAGS
ncbi:MAG: DUF1775 domain-containing protein [Acidimicrobiales bacterium]